MSGQVSGESDVLQLGILRNAKRADSHQLSLKSRQNYSNLKLSDHVFSSIRSVIQSELSLKKMLYSSLMYFHLDGSEELEVNKGKESEGDEGHPQEVGDEDVVPRVRQVRSQAGGTEPGKHQMEIS